MTEIKPESMGGKVGGMRRRLRAEGYAQAEIDKIVGLVFQNGRKRDVQLPLGVRKTIAARARDLGRCVVTLNGNSWKVFSYEGYQASSNAGKKNLELGNGRSLCSTVQQFPAVEA